jgi:hypothetical protein
MSARRVEKERVGVFHLINEAARDAGHADAVRELLDGHGR